MSVDLLKRVNMCISDNKKSASLLFCNDFAPQLHWHHIKHSDMKLTVTVLNKWYVYWYIGKIKIYGRSTTGLFIKYQNAIFIKFNRLSHRNRTNMTLVLMTYSVSFVIWADGLIWPTFSFLKNFNFVRSLNNMLSRYGPSLWPWWKWRCWLY